MNSPERVTVVAAGNPLTNPLAIKAVSDEIKALIACLDATGRSDLPTPAQLDALITLGRELPGFDRIAVALSHLQTRLSSNAVHPYQGLAIAACLLSLQQWTERWNATTGMPIAQAIAAALDAIGDQEHLPAW